MHHFFLPPSSIRGEVVTFPSEIAYQIFRVLRLQPGVSVVVLDNQGGRFKVKLTVVGQDYVEGNILERSSANGEPPVRLHMLLCLTQREKFEWMLQKCTEVGASEFTPVISSRALVQDGHSLENKHTRWEKIIREAAEQSRRGRIPQLNRPAAFTECLHSPGLNKSARLIAWEDDQATRLPLLLQGLNSDSAAILIGPEGGLSVGEVELARQSGWRSFSLGPRILRMETAAVVAAALTVEWSETQKT